MNASDINKNFDLLGLVEGLTNLVHSGIYWIGRCPLPTCTSQHDALSLKQTGDGWKWFCRKCGEGKYHSPIDFYMRLHNVEFKAAVTEMGGEIVANPIQQKLPIQSVVTPKTMPNISWQEEAWQKVYKSCESLLYQDIGQLGRDYLHSRSITKETAEKFIIGFLFHYDPMAMKMRPAISIPWFDNSSQICSVKIRFIDVNSNGSRYTSLKGSVPLFFGFSSVTSVCDKLVIVEGEMNAMSVWQTKPEKTAVISIGSDTNIQSEQLRLLARNFNQSFIWLDNIEKCVELRSLLPGSTAVQSQISGNVKLDANMMLQNRTLSDFISQMIK